MEICSQMMRFLCAGFLRFTEEFIVTEQNLPPGMASPLRILCAGHDTFLSWFPAETRTPLPFEFFLETLLPAVNPMTLFIPGQGEQIPTRKVGFSGGVPPSL